MSIILLVVGTEVPRSGGSSGWEFFRTPVETEPPGDPRLQPVFSVCLRTEIRGGVRGVTFHEPRNPPPGTRAPGVLSGPTVGSHPQPDSNKTKGVRGKRSVGGTDRSPPLRPVPEKLPNPVKDPSTPVQIRVSPEDRHPRDGVVSGCGVGGGVESTGRPRPGSMCDCLVVCFCGGWCHCECGTFLYVSYMCVCMWWVDFRVFVCLR